MAGNAVGPSAVLVCSRCMNRALDIDAEARTAQDEAGVLFGCAAECDRVARAGLRSESVLAQPLHAGRHRVLDLPARVILGDGRCHGVDGKVVTGVEEVAVEDRAAARPADVVWKPSRVQLTGSRCG
ncbi:hypothetical protein GCM10027074_76060 [Streptomyces deserti]